MMCHRKDPVEVAFAFCFYLFIYTGWFLVFTACITGIPVMLLYPDSGPVFAALFFSGCFIGMFAELFRGYVEKR